MAEVANVRVFCRVRPPNERERGVTSTSLGGSAALLARKIAASGTTPFTKKCISIPTSSSAPHPQTVFLHSKHGVARTFTFDRVFDEDASQDDVFAAVGAPITQACLQGYNGTIFAYGQTGSGKTFTMQGPDDVLDTERQNLSPQELELRGLVPRVFDYLFQNVVAMDKGANVQHTFACSFLEIYNERVYDLLGGGSANDTTGLQLRENGRKGVHVEGLIESVVTNAQEAAKLMTRGAQNRRVGQTSMNRESSRSHSVFILQLQSKEVTAEGTKTRTSRFNLVDLAGSERQRSTEAAGERLKEANSINKSLSALGNVIMGLSEQSAGKNRHVHYRDSKLTFLLKDSLGGNSKTFMIATVSPAEDSSFETLSTLKFAQRAKMIQNNAVINEDSTGSTLFLQEEIQKLRRQLRQAHQEIARGMPGSSLLSQDSEISSGVGDTGESSQQQLAVQCDPAVDSRFRELEEAFASTIEKNDRLQRSCEFLQLREENFQTLCTDMKRNITHLKLLLRMRSGQNDVADGDMEMLEYEPSSDAIEWRIKYEEMEERFIQLQEELQQRDNVVSNAGKLSRQADGEVENLNLMLLALTKQLAFVVRDKHDLQDRLLQHEAGEDGSMDTTSEQEAEHVDFSARLEEALKQQANEYESKMDALMAISKSFEEKATETAYELLEIKQREGSWMIQHNDMATQLTDMKNALLHSKETQASTQNSLVQEKQRVADLQVQLERTRESVRLDFESTLADTNTENRELKGSNALLQENLKTVKTELKQSEQREQEAQGEISDFKLTLNLLEETNRGTTAKLEAAQDTLKQMEAEAAEMQTDLAGRDRDIQSLRRSEAALVEEKLGLETQLGDANKRIEQLGEDARAGAKNHAEAMELLKQQTEEEVQKFEGQLREKVEQLEHLQSEVDAATLKAKEAGQEHSRLLREKQTAMESLQREFDEHKENAANQLADEKRRAEAQHVCAQEELGRFKSDVAKLQQEKDTLESERCSLANRVETLSATVNELQTRKSELEKKCEEQEAELGHRDNAIKKSAEEMQALQQQIEGLNKAHEAKLASVQKSADEAIEALRRDVSRAELCVQEKQTEVDHLKTQNDELMAKCAQQVDKITRESEAHTVATERVASLEKSVDRQMQELADKSEALKSVESQLAELKTASEREVKELKHRMAEQSEAMDSVSAELKHTSSELEATQQELQSALSDREEYTRSLSEQLSDLRGKLREAEDVAGTQSDEIRKYKAIQTSLDGDLRKLEVERLALEECLETERKAKDEVELQFHEAQKKWQNETDERTQHSKHAIAALEKRVAELTSTESNLSTLKLQLERDNESLQASVSDRDEKIRSLELNIEDQAVKYSASQAKLEKTVAELQGNMTQQEAKFQQKLTALSDRDGTIQTLQDHLRSNEETWDRKAQQYEAELESTRSRVQELERLVDESKVLFEKEQAALQSEKQLLQQTLERSDDAVKHRTQCSQELEQEVERLNLAVMHKDEELKRTKETLVDVEGRLERAMDAEKTARTEETELELKRLTQELAEMESKHSALVEENEAFKKQQETTTDLKTQEEELKRRRSEVEAAESKLEAERKTLEDRKATVRPVVRDPKVKKTSEDELKRQFLREKVKLQREVQSLSKKLESVSKENEKLVGHHNARQKIQHHAKVKEENNRLLEQVRKLTDDKFKMHSRLEKLQAVLKEKENIGVEPQSNTPSSVGSTSGNTLTNRVSASKVRRSSTTSSTGGSATAARAAVRMAHRVPGARVGTTTRVPARTRPAPGLPGTPRPSKRPRPRFQ